MHNLMFACRLTRVVLTQFLLALALGGLSLTAACAATFTVTTNADSGAINGLLAGNSNFSGGETACTDCHHGVTQWQQQDGGYLYHALKPGRGLISSAKWEINPIGVNLPDFLYFIENQGKFSGIFLIA